MSLRDFSSLAGLALGLLTMGGFLLRWWSGDHFIITRLINYLLPWFLVALLPLLLLTIVMHRWWVVTLLAASSLLIIVTYAPLFWPVWPARTSASASRSEKELTIMSYNVWSANRKVPEMVRVIQETDPDILLLQEIGPITFASLRDTLAASAEKTLHAAYEPKLLQGVVSRFPLLPLKALRKMGQAQKIAVDTPHGEVTVFNVHPLRRGNWQRRHNQIAALLEEEILGVPGPVILGGDFNATDQTQMYRRLTRHLHNAHWEAGYGFGFTYPSNEITFFGLRAPSLVRIDHIFYNNHFRALSAGTIDDSGGSDHYPVTARLAFVHPTR